MAPQTPFQSMVEGYAALLRQRPAAPAATPARARVAPGAPTVLLFSPHPDDECITGALPLRLLRQCGMRVVNVAVTLGSRVERRASRLEELGAACRWLGFDLVLPGDGGLERIVPETRADDPAAWAAAVARIAALLVERRPNVVFCPHAEDWNRTHVGTHHLVFDALARLPADSSLLVVETEYWGAMRAPNLMVESTGEDVTALVDALALHAGEVARNPYHLRLPAWMIDNVRRGAELVLGQGAGAPDVAFATLYRVRRWAGGRLRDGHDGGIVLAGRDDPARLFDPHAAGDRPWR